MHILAVDIALEHVGDREVTELELIHLRAGHFGFVGDHRSSSLLP